MVCLLKYVDPRTLKIRQFRDIKEQIGEIFKMQTLSLKTSKKAGTHWV